jgi:hypothetical protein
VSGLLSVVERHCDRIQMVVMKPGSGTDIERAMDLTIEPRRKNEVGG